jgi:hypothetical protein
MPLGEKLIAERVVSSAQVEEALAIQKESPGKKIGAILVELGYISQAQLEAAIAN